MELITNETQVANKSLFAGNAVKALTKVVTIVTGEKLVKGALLGKITASGKFKMVTAAATDGSKVAQYILAEDVDASTADTKAVVYTTGEFLTGALVVGDDDTVAAHEDELHKCSIFMTSAQ